MNAILNLGGVIAGVLTIGLLVSGVIMGFSED
jgi:hypothetical protein